jgi:hypothetical protein
MQPLIIKPRAIGMAKEAYDWYEQQSKGLGEIFLSELNTCYKKIEAQPAFYSKAKKNFRQLRLLVSPEDDAGEISYNESCKCLSNPIIFSNFRKNRVSPGEKHSRQVLTFLRR